MRKRGKLLLVAAIMAMVVVSILSAGTAFASGPAKNGECAQVVDPEGKSDICHRTGSDTNPYIFLESIPNNAKGHFEEHVENPLFGRTDIIPAP